MWNDYRQRIGYSAILAGLIVVLIDYIQGDFVVATILLAVLGVLCALLYWWTRRRRGRYVSHAAARAAAGRGDVIIYCRPGCVHCDRLKLGLGRARRDVSWVNVLHDPEAAEFVAARHRGNLVVPTAVTGAGTPIDATADAIKAQLARNH